MVDVSIIIACYNEEQLLQESVKKIISIMDATRWEYELIFVDDCSQDNTRLVINNIVDNDKTHKYQKLFHNQNTGRGKTVKDGMLRANGTYIGYLDIDLEVGAHYIPLMIINLQQGSDVAIAYRVYKETLGLFFRATLSIGYRFLVRTLLKMPIKDTETGFKFFKRNRILPVLKKTEEPGWFWDTEIIALSYYSNLKIAELPCLFIRRYDKKSSVHIVRDTLEYFVKLVNFYHKQKND
jgi:glycosyltransferase involved in cell wall biosynthesis